jgi:hypothetical protein
LLGGYGNCYSFQDFNNGLWLIDTSFNTNPVSNYTINLAAYNNATICSNGSTPIYSGILAADNYLWNNGDTSYYTIATTPGKYWVKVNINGQILSDTILITSAPNIAFLPNDTVVCNYQLLTITIPNNLYLPYLNNVQSTNTFIAANSGSYIVSASNVDGCILTDTLNVSYFNNNKINFGNDTQLCKNEKIVLNTSITNASYLWSNGNTSNQNTIDSNSTKIWLTAIDTFGCNYSDTINILWRNNPAINLGSDKYLCNSNSNVTFQPNIIYTCFGSYTWNGTYIFGSLGATTPGQYIYSLTDCFGCSSNDTVNVTNTPNYLFTLGNDTTICANSNFKLQAPLNALAYYWSTGSQQNNITPLVTNSYSVNIVDTFGCNKYDTIDITVLNNSDADSIIVNKSGNNFTFTLAQATNVNTTNWVLMPGNQQSNSTPAIFNNLPNGTYTITATLNNGVCPSKTISKIFSIVANEITNLVINSFNVQYLNQQLQINATHDKNDIATIRLLDDKGKIINVWNNYYFDKMNILKTNNLCPGIYLVQINTSGNCYTSKILIME